jgi:hypothetical protein
LKDDEPETCFGFPAEGHYALVGRVVSGVRRTSKTFPS